jgi:dTMP kinase
MKSELISFPVYGSFFGSEIRRLLDGDDGASANTVDPRSMALWYALDRKYSFKSPWSYNEAVIANRWTLSNAVYQSARAAESEANELFDWILRLEHEQLGLPAPDMTIIIDVEPSLSMLRSKTRDSEADRGSRPDLYERSAELLTSARSKYLDAAARFENVAIVSSVDRSGQERAPEYVHEDILNLISAVRL